MQKIDDCKAIHLALALLGTTRVQKMFTFETATGDETAYGGVTAYMLSNCKNFMFELLRHVTAPNFPFMSKLPRPPPLYHHHFTTTTLPPPLYHHSAYRKLGLQLFYSGQICRPWCRPNAPQYSSYFVSHECVVRIWMLMAVLSKHLDTKSRQ
jgi:hypothetical protein